ncbi:MAG: AsmA family protein [Candidatus Omnitrophota bacterium]
MKTLKTLAIILGIVFLLTVAFSVATFLVVKHLKIKDLVEQEIEQELGIKVRIQNLTFSPLLSHISAQGISIKNPAGFDEQELAYINSIHFVWDIGEIVLLKKPSVYLIALDLARLHIIKNKSGKVNLKELLPLQEQGPSEDPTPFSFDVLVLSVGQVTYTDQTLRPPKTHIYNVGIEGETFFSVVDEEKLIRLIVYNALKNTDVGKMIGLNLALLSGVSETIEAALGTATSYVKGLYQIASTPFKFLFSR